MASLTDFPSSMSRRLQGTVAPMTEANLYRHTIMNPVSREAKLKNILSYVSMQRELIVLEDDPYRTDSASSWSQTGLGRKPQRNDLGITDDFVDSTAHQNLHNHRASSPPPLPPPHQRHVRPPRHEAHQAQTQQSRRTSQLISQPLSQQQQFPSQPNFHSQYQYQDEPDGLDPAMALPRALPRSSARQEPSHPSHPSHQYPPHRHSVPRDPFYSGIGQENDWRHLEELDPDSLAGIHLYGDPAELQRLQQLSPAAASSPLVNLNASIGNNGLKYPVYEYSPTLGSVRHPRELQPSNFRQVQYLEYDDADDEGADEQDYEVDMALRQNQNRRHSQQMGQRRPPQPRQVISPAPNSIDKEKKNGRFSSRFSFLTRRRPAQHQRHESMPAVPKEPWSGIDSNSGHTRVHSLSQRRSNGQLSGTIAIEEEAEGGYGATKPKGSNKVKKLFKDVFGISGKKKDHSPESSIRDISMPSTYHARASSAPPNQPHPNQETSIHSANVYTPAAPPRRGLVTPVSRPGTSHSNYQNNSAKNARRESLVDPSPNHRLYQELEDEDDMDLPRQSSYGNIHGHFVQTSLTPPPASSVLRHSASSHRLFANQGHPVRNSHLQESDAERTLIYGSTTGRHSSTHIQDLKSQGLSMTGAAAVATGRPKPRPVSQMVILPNNNHRRSTNYVPVHQSNSHKGNTSGEYDYTSTSNGTTLNNNSSSSHSNSNGNGNGNGYFGNFSQPQNPQRKHQRLPSFDYDRYESTSYDNGPTLVSKAQVQRVDLEGLRQDHSHHSHPHHLRMVPVEAPYA